MAYVPFTEAETNFKKPHRQALWKKVKGNDDDHKARVDGLEGLSASALIDHFQKADPAIGFTNIPPHSSLWSTAVTGATAHLRITPGTHVLVITTSIGDPRARLRGNYRVQPTLLPLMRMRMKVSSFGNIEDGLWGFATDRALATDKGDDMVALHKSKSPAHLKFLVRQDGVETLGATDIGLPAAGTYFTVEIKYTAVDTVECRFDGALIETFATGDPSNVPDVAADDMWPEIHQFHDGVVGDNLLSVDRLEIRNTLIADEA